MHRQAMLVSLSLSPASTAAKNDKHWAFLVRSEFLGTLSFFLVCFLKRSPGKFKYWKVSLS